jgi:hypothetical protein
LQFFRHTTEIIQKKYKISIKVKIYCRYSLGVLKGGNEEDCGFRKTPSVLDHQNPLFFLWSFAMQVKVYTPRIIEIASEYLPALAKRAADSLGERAGEISATRGHLVRQAVQDGLLREFDDLIGEDGTVDLVCDPGMEIPLELENQTLTLTELLEALHYKRSWSEMKSKNEAA